MKMTEWWRRLRFLGRHDRRIDDLDDEMRLHLELRSRALEREGLSPAEAARQARRRFGNTLALREESRDIWGFLSIERLAQDLRHAKRQLLRHPSSTMAVVLTLALGIAANVSMFALLDATLFRPPTASDPSRLVWIAATEQPAGRYRNLSYPEYRVYRDHTDLFAGVLAFEGIQVSLGGASPMRTRGLLVSGNYFDVLGVRAQVGRTFTPGEDTPGAEPVVVLSDAIWRNRYGADSSVVNRPISLNGRTFRVVGVAPPGFQGQELDEALPNVWLTIATIAQAMPGQADLLTRPDAGWLRVIGRLGAGVSITQADAAVAVIGQHLEFRPAAETAATTIHAFGVSGTLDPSNRSEAAPVLGLLSIVPFLVLVVACANAANVLLARSAARTKELAMRRALGASRARIIRQLLTEYLLIAAIAGAAGVVLSFALTSVIGVAGEIPAPILEAFRPNLRVLMLTVALAILTGVVCGLAPALTAAKPSLLPAIRDDVATVRVGRRRIRLRSAFVVVQVAVSLTLLVTAGLFLQSTSKALHVNPGFDAAHAVTVSYDLSLQGYAPAAATAFNERLLEHVRTLHGVTSAALVNVTPLGGRMYGTEVQAEGAATDRDGVTAGVASLTPGYFATLRTRIVGGRDFDVRDRAGAPMTVIVNETLARRLWTDKNPVGQRLKVSGRNKVWREVVGVAADAKYVDLTEDPRAFFYLPLAQQPAAPLSVVARTTVDEGTTLTAVTRFLQAADPDLPLFNTQTLEQAIRGGVDKQRAASSMLSVFGTLALLLSALGMYGVTAHAVALRTKEIGIRMSLGARATDVTRMFVRETMARSAIGIAIGLALSAALSHVMASFLFGLRATDLTTFAAGALAIAGVAAVASLIPARRAAKVDPIRALRSE